MRRSLPLALSTLAVLAAGPLAAQKILPNPQVPLTVSVTPWGPSQEKLDAAREKLLASAEIRSRLSTDNRLLWFDMVWPEEKVNGSYVAPDHFRATFYDYGKKQPFVFEGRLDAPESPELLPRPADEPDPNTAEYEAATAIVKADARFATAIAERRLSFYPPMPPLVTGQRNRTLTVGVISLDPGSRANEIVGVDMITREVNRYPSGAPMKSMASPDAGCGAPNAGQGTTAKGTAGQFEVVVTQGPTEIWRLVVVRPSASSGLRGSGVELINVDYKGKRILSRAHAPILNVQYTNDACGPYRDWQYQEGFFSATGTDVAPGVRQCTAPPSVILENGTDTGNFKGIAYWVSGSDIRLVSELEAGWYRYITDFRLLGNGTIQPRFGFGGVNNTCICSVHNHHVYWRFDFDVAGTTNRITEDRLFGGVVQARELSRKRDGKTTWTISNPLTNESYRLVPGGRDGVADKYGRNDIWFVRNKANEVDDGVNCTSGGSCPTWANIEKFVTQESIQDTDVIVWYGAHFVHDELNGQAEDHVVGPDFILRRW